MITANDNGVLRSLGTVSENNGGVLHEMNTVHANDGGVLREIFSSSVDSATVDGITPLVVAEDHLVIVNNGSFTLSAPKGARIIVGGAAQGTSGGNVAEYVLDKNTRNAVCVSNCAAVNSGGATTLTVNGTTYDSGSTRQIIQSKWGPIGGSGGYGSTSGNGGNGSGAGGGGGARRYWGRNGNYGGDTAGKGGNYGGYGNQGGNAKGAGHHGGDGGYAAGGGGYGSLTDYFHTEDEYGYFGTVNGTVGSGGAGIIVIEW
ncbi:MAG: hypothetical protein HDT42_09265 [Ruminococcaceae bacterium]|nr:hypothetical protein [Oscillospiraceae bacterium]